MKKKKGSSLIFVILTFAIITIVGTSILSLTLMSYKKRIVESTEKRNQYFSESGLDVAYGVIGKVIDDAISNGNSTITDYTDRLNDEISNEKENFAQGNKDNNKYLNEDGSVNEELIAQEKNDIFRKTYEHSVSMYIFNNDLVNNGIAFKNTDYDSNDVRSTPKVVLTALNDVPTDTNGEYKNKTTDETIDILNLNKSIKSFFKDIQYNNKSQPILNLKLQSTFSDKGVEKKISANYNVLVPNYNDTYYVSTNKVNLPVMEVWKKAFCIDGDLNISGNFTVDGDMYVKGNGVGVDVNGDNSLVTLNGNIATAKNFQISNSNSTVNINKGNVYASNVEIKEGADKSNLTVENSVYTNNDLALNASQSHINISNFYGINDVSKASDDESTKPLVSSCIRVNAEDIGEDEGSSIAIKNEAILMGTAYINTSGNMYQTGESVSIKGNYAAYSKTLNSSDETKYKINSDLTLSQDNNNNPILREKGDLSNVLFDYIDPLQLVTQFNNANKDKLNWQDKSDYFAIYAKQHETDSDNGGLNLKGIKLPNNITHIGASIVTAKDGTQKVNTGNYTNDDIAKVEPKQEDYANMVYEMGDSKGVVDSNNNSRLPEVYTQGVVEKSVSNQINFDSINNDGTKNLSNNGKDIIYLNKDSNIDYVIMGKGGEDAASKIDHKGRTVVSVNLDANGNGKGIIVTKGNVYLCGSINFTGTIIGEENLEVENDAQKTLTYDPTYVQWLIAGNYENLFQNLFVGNPTGEQGIEVNSDTSTDSTVGTDAIRDKLIHMEKWKIEK